MLVCLSIKRIIRLIIIKTFNLVSQFLISELLQIMTLAHLDTIHYAHTLIVTTIGLIATLIVSAQILSTEIISKVTNSEAV